MEKTKGNLVLKEDKWGYTYWFWDDDWDSIMEIGSVFIQTTQQVMCKIPVINP